MYEPRRSMMKYMGCKWNYLRFSDIYMNYSEKSEIASSSAPICHRIFNDRSFVFFY